MPFYVVQYVTFSIVQKFNRVKSVDLNQILYAYTAKN
jgi:hypothetical protein